MFLEGGFVEVVVVSVSVVLVFMVVSEVLESPKFPKEEEAVEGLVSGDDIARLVADKPPAVEGLR